MTRKLTTMSFRSLDDPPSRRPPSADEVKRRATIRGEIASVKLYGLITEPEIKEIHGKIKYARGNE